MAHVRGAPYHPMTQGKIERWHQTLKNRILLENYYLPGDLEAQIKALKPRRVIAKVEWHPLLGRPINGRKRPYCKFRRANPNFLLRYRSSQQG